MPAHGTQHLSHQFIKSTCIGQCTDPEIPSGGGGGHDNVFLQSEISQSIPRNSVESDNGCTSKIYFDNAGDNVTLTLYNATLTLQKPCLHNNKCDCSKTNGLNEVYVFSIKSL